MNKRVVIGWDSPWRFAFFLLALPILGALIGGALFLLINHATCR